MTTLQKINQYANENHLMFRDFRHEGIINDPEPPRYALLYPNTFSYRAKFDTQAEIEEFLESAEKDDFKC
jgi:hypothetical protein